MKIVCGSKNDGTRAFWLFGTLDGRYWHIVPGRKWQSRHEQQRARSSERAA